MKEILPWIGDRKARRRIDELFSRETLGAVLFGSAASKVVEKINTVGVVILLIYFLGIELNHTVWVLALFLLFSWFIELILFTYLYIKWEEAMEAASEAAEKAKEKKDEVTEDSNE